MLTRLTRTASVAVLVWAAAAPRAEAADRPLLVVVETGAGVTSDAETIRAAIAAELGTPIVAPHVPSIGASAATRLDALLVVIDRQRMVVTLRGQGDGEVTRSAPTPTLAAAQLHAVAALASEVARDRTPAGLPPATSTAEAGGPRAPAAPPLPAAPIAPPGPSMAVLRAQGVGLAPTAPEWTFSFVGGAATTFPSPWQSAYVSGSRVISWSPAAQLEAHRYVGNAFVGAAVDLGPGPIHRFGVALLAGPSIRAGRVCLEASGGLGVEAFVDRDHYLDGAPPGYADHTRPAGYARLTMAASYELTPALELLAQGGGHLTVTSQEDAGFGLAALGVRMHVP